MQESQWYQMMGLSKVFLRNFLIGCFLLLIVTVTTLATLLNNSNEERRKDVREFTTTINYLNQKCQEMAEAKNIEYIHLLKEALEKQQQIDRELQKLKQR